MGSQEQKLDLKHLSYEQLVALAQNGDNKALFYIISRLTLLVNKICSTFHCYTLDTDDLVQEGMIGLISSINSFQKNPNSASFKTYASICISNRIKSAIRTNSRHKHKILSNSLSLEIDVVDLSASTPEENLISIENYKQIVAFLYQTLSSFEMEVLKLYLAGYSYTKIAHHLDSTAKSIDNALQRVRRKLRKLDRN